MATNALALDGINAYYGDSHVLYDVSFTLGEAKLLGLLGRNGAGKSTCMAVAMGILQPRRGTVSVFGVDLAGRPPEAVAAQGVALVPQGRRIFKSLSVAENLLVAARAGRNGQQMLAIGRALMGNPRVVLMDEPSEGLAPQIVAEVMATVKRLKDEGLSIILVEQNAKLVFEIADDIVVLNSGHLVVSGRAADLSHTDLHQHLGVY